MPTLRAHSTYIWLSLAIAVHCGAAAALRAADIGARTDGNWDDASIWSYATVPGQSDIVYIGSDFPFGSALTATVTLTHDQFADSVILGYSNGCHGMLDLGDSRLTVSNSLYLGYYAGATGSIQRGSGSFSCNGLYVDHGNSLALGTLDVANYVNLTNSSTLTTAAASNVTWNVSVYSGSTLTLGADMTLAGHLDVSDDGSTLDMAGHSLQAHQLTFGWNGGSPALRNRGPLTVNSLFVANQTFDLNAIDSIYGLCLRNGTSTIGIPIAGLTLSDNSMATLTAAGNVTGNVNIYSGSTLTLGADMTLTGTLDLASNGSTLDMAGHSLSASQILLGWSGGSPTLLARGPLTAYYLNVANQNFDLNVADTVASFSVSNGTSTINTPLSGLYLYNNSTVTTTAAGNVTGNVGIYSGGTLTLGADMTLVGSLDVSNDGSTLNMAGHSLETSHLALGWNGGTTTLLNRGRLTVTYLYVANQAFDLNPTDLVSSFYLSNGASTINTPLSGLSLSNNATATTTAAGNVTGDMSVYSGGTLTLGVDMTLNGTVDLEHDGSTLDMAGHSLSARQILIGWSASGTPTLLHRGPLTATYLNVAGQAFDLNPTDSVYYFVLNNGSSTINTPISVLSLTNNSTATWIAPLVSLGLSGCSTAATTAAANVTGNVSVYSGGTLTLGADMSLSGTLDLVHDGSTLDMAGHSLTAYQFLFGWNGGKPTLLSRGPLTVTHLNVAGQAFDLDPTDSVSYFALSNGTSTINTPIVDLTLYGSSSATITTAGDVTGNASVYSGGTLTLGADMTLSGNLDLSYNGSTLDMAGHSLNANQVFVGWNGSGTPTLLHRGPLTANDLYVANASFDLNATDKVWSLTVGGGSTVTTAAAGNVTGHVSVHNGGTLTLGAEMSLSGNLDLADTGSTFDMAGHSLHADQLMLGWNGGSPTLLGRGPLAVNVLFVANQAFNPNATDSVTNFILSNGTSTINSPLLYLGLHNYSTATTTASGNVTKNVLVYSGSTLTLGADMTLSGALDLANIGSTLDMAGHSLNAYVMLIGWNGGGETLLNRGPLTVGVLYVGYQAFDLLANDSAYTLDLNGASVRTTAAGNITGNASVPAGSTLTLGADMTLTGDLNVRNGGALRLGTDVVLAAHNVLIEYGGMLEMRGHNATIMGPLSGGGLVDNAEPSTASVLTVGGNNASSTFDGTIQNSGALATLSLTKIGAGAVTLNGLNTYAGRTTVKAGTLHLGPAAHDCVLNVGGADVQGGKIVFDYNGANSPAATIKSLLTASYDGGLWDVGQFRSSTAAANGLTLGWFDDGSNAVTVMATYAGDFNLDGVVNAADLEIWKANAGRSATWQMGDGNYDGVVNLLDLDLWKANVGRPAVGSSPSGANADVPEPGTLMMLAAGLCGLFAYVRRRRLMD